MGHQEEMYKCFERYNLPTLNKEEIENINRQITSIEKKPKTNKKKPHMIKKFSTNKSPGPEGFTGILSNI